MNKAELIQASAVKAEVSLRDANAVVQAVLDIIEESLVNGEEVKLSGFGIFEKKERAGRVGTNPSTGEKINIPASRSISFKPSKSLKERIQ